VAVETGKTTKVRAKLYMRTDDGFGESAGDGCCVSAGDGCCVSAVNVWSVLSPMRSKREDFAGCTCAAALIALSVF
jgi:hypothetical protein